MGDDNFILLAGLLSAVGLGYLVYGKKQRRAVAVLSGVGLCVLPYFISGLWILAALSLGLMALPFFIKR